MRIGILCPSEIAYRRFLPALKQVEDESAQLNIFPEKTGLLRQTRRRLTSVKIVLHVRTD